MPVRKWCSLSDLVACAASPAEEIFLVDSLDNIAATFADEICWLIKQSFSTNKLYPVSHGWGFIFFFEKVHKWHKIWGPLEEI